MFCKVTSDGPNQLAPYFKQLVGYLVGIFPALLELGITPGPVPARSEKPHTCLLNIASANEVLRPDI